MRKTSKGESYQYQPTNEKTNEKLRRKLLRVTGVCCTGDTWLEVLEHLPLYQYRAAKEITKDRLMRKTSKGENCVLYR